MINPATAMVWAVCEEEAVPVEEAALGEEEPVLSEEEPVLSEEEPVLSEEEPVLSEEEPVLSDEEPKLGGEDAVPAAAGGVADTGNVPEVVTEAGEAVPRIMKRLMGTTKRTPVIAPNITKARLHDRNRTLRRSLRSEPSKLVLSGSRTSSLLVKFIT